MIRFRIVAKDGHWKSRDQIAPHRTLEFKRDSKAAQAEVRKIAAEFLAQHRPCENGEIDLGNPNAPTRGAHAWIESSDRHGSRTLAQYFGIVDARIQPSGMASRGRWVLRARFEDSGFPSEIKA